MVSDHRYEAAVDARSSDRRMLLALQVANVYGSQPGAWRMPGTDPSSYTDMDVFDRYAQAAERGKIQLIFLADTGMRSISILAPAYR